MSRLLLHACCGPCSVFPSQFLRGQQVDYTLYFFNPNIQPYQEFKKRLRSFREYAEAEKITFLVDKDYPLEEFLRASLQEKISRCHYCYKVRMQQTAKYARENGFTKISTTLLGSPYQQHELLRFYAQEAAAAYQVEFAYFDFRPGFAEGMARAKEKELYRQSYCGCVFSERDRYEKRKKSKASAQEISKNNV